MTTYGIWEKSSAETYHYVGWFSLLEDAIEFCRRQETKCIVCKETSLIASEIVYKNY